MRGRIRIRQGRASLPVPLHLLRGRRRCRSAFVDQFRYKDELDALFEQWQDVSATDPQLKHRVWTRIAAGDTRQSQALPDWLERLLGILSQPLGATAFVAASVVCGILIAEMRVNRVKSIRTEELAQNYIQLIEARTHTFETEDAQ